MQREDIIMEENYNKELIETYEKVKEFVDFLENEINTNKETED